MRPPSLLTLGRGIPATRPIAPLRLPALTLRAHSGCGHSHAEPHSHSHSHPHSHSHAHAHAHSHAHTHPASTSSTSRAAARPGPGPGPGPGSARPRASPADAADIAAQTLPVRTPGTPLNTPSAGGPKDAAAYCASLVRRLDPDAWLCSYFWPRREREWWLAIRALNLELHLVSTTVTQPAIAAMRFQFWRDALAAVYATDGRPVPQHPVVVALAEMHKHRPVQRYYLSQLVEVRAKTLANPPASPTLESYLSTYSPLSSALLLGPLPLLLSPTDPGTSHLAHTLSHIAQLLTVTTLLRGLPALIGKKQLSLPSDVAAAHGIVDEQVFRHGAEAPGFRDAVFQIATRGMDELITARTDLKSTDGKVVPSQAMPVFLAAVPAERWLQRLEKADFDVFSPDLQKFDWRLAPRIWARYLSGKL